MQTIQHSYVYLMDDFYEVSGLELNGGKEKQQPSGLELIVGTMKYQLLEETLNGLNTKLIKSFY